MLARVPPAFAFHLDVGVVHAQVQRPLGSAIRDGRVRCLLAPLGSVLQMRLPGSGRDRVLKSGTAQPRLHSSSKLATTPVV
ncbi:hypothetical protein SSE37_00020 [Sagittula stellata E-37]|uniref:Uncharacterized protein n=1 Tax=Sagittula stellata (strain ATCC 700073 / DSM 11524 / E-37) TaxID=388399 RepID=A3KBE3_SAGS3|nr:hypothetical protein SSE37_00020 [Sagittula stellata E-37]